MRSRSRFTLLAVSMAMVATIIVTLGVGVPSAAALAPSLPKTVHVSVGYHSSPDDIVWANTGIDVSPAQPLLITATGFWVVNLDESWGFLRGASGPDGLGSGWSGDQFTNFGG